MVLLLTKQSYRVFLATRQLPRSYSSHGQPVVYSEWLIPRRHNSSFPGFKESDPTFATRAIHAHQDPEQWQDGKPIVVPISLATTFKQEAPAEFISCEYSRTGSPTRDVLEKVLANLEGAKHGLVFGSGMAAISTIINLLEAGDHIVSSVDLYGGTSVYLKNVADKFNIKTTFVTDVTDPINIQKALQANTKLVWIESPSNPTMKLVDIERVASIVHSTKNKNKGDILLAVDNTFLSPYFQRPLELGADIVMHSATKYLNGHSDVLMGAAMINDQVVHERLRSLQGVIGGVPSPFDCYLVNRGLKTLHIRMREHQRNAFAAAQYLESHPCIERVLHPGLPSHPQHELAKRQSYGHSGMVTFFVKGAGEKEIRAFVKALKVITLAESLGGYESLVKIPALMPPRYELGVPVNLVRFSVGLEDISDIISDLDQALKTALSP